MQIAEAIDMIKSQDMSTEAAILDDIWIDLERKIINNPVPEEHRKILDERINKIKLDKAMFTDWAALKANLLYAKGH